MARCRAVVSGAATAALMPRATAAGVLGMARTMPAETPRRDERSAMRFPARIDKTSVFFPIRARAPAAALSRVCGLIARTRASGEGRPSGLAVRRTPRLARSARPPSSRSGSIAVMREGSSPCASQPESIAWPIFPAPRSTSEEGSSVDMIASLFQSAERLGAKLFAWVDELILRLDEQKLARARFRRSLHDAEDRADCRRERICNRAHAQIMHEEKRGERVPCPVEIPAEPWGPHEMHDLAVRRDEIDRTHGRRVRDDGGDEDDPRAARMQFGERRQEIVAGRNLLAREKFE